jgi:hypothetical protein
MSPGVVGNAQQGLAIEAGDDLHEPVLVMTFDRALELADQGPLVIALVPGRDGLGNMVTLTAAIGGDSAGATGEPAPERPVD